ncbi:recombinase family protein [Tunturiibacter lichenicola]|uniref:recombinase family protein n=1 Tax=Tunturiibacter lichenicola TaxID=2051959 RepID=UPI0021B409DA|nr:recombinase family protein [Edaphobacter lichenicola]
MSEKIRPIHTERGACVYVRQSSMQQVRTRLEGQRRQYDLRERAQLLGFQRVTVIDEDQGRTGTGAVERPGFGRLLTAVCSGTVGAVLALEASRLARNNRDWHHLIDLCAMAGTLVIDHDGVYDPSLLNDRLLLGLKGTMSEFEISLLRQRAMEAHRQKVQRGMVLTQVPVGYVRTEDEGMEKTPDRQVQEALAGVFRKFRELGSARQVLLWYRDEKLLLPALSRESGNRKVIWIEPIYSRIFGMLKNPTYAGVFVWGRNHTRTAIVEGRARKTRGHARPQDQWEVVIPEHHEGYITWDEYMRNQQQIRANAGWNARMGQLQGAARSGPALLAGLLRCARCGRALQVTYSNSKQHGPLPRYWCSGDRSHQLVRSCVTFAGTRVDQEIAAEVLQALRPVGIQAAFDALERSQSQTDEKRSSLEMALQKARYETARIERQYQATEPENRLVAAELEKRWNTALNHVREMEQRVEEASVAVPSISPQQREQLLALGDDLEQLWDHPDASVTLKKRILRTVLQEVIADTRDDPPEVHLKLHWVGGSHTELTVRKNKVGYHNHINSEEVTELIRELALVCEDSAIVSILNRLGYRTGNNNTWTEKHVQHVRHTKGYPACPPPEQRRWITMQQAAAALSVSDAVVRRLVMRKTLPAKQIVKFAPWMIERAHLELPAVHRAGRLVHTGKRSPSLTTSNVQTPMFIDASEV